MSYKGRYISNLSTQYLTISARRLLQIALAIFGIFQFAVPVLAAPFAYITQYSSNLVSVIDSATNSVVSTIQVGQAPEGVAFHPNNSIVFVSNRASNSVSVINTNSQLQTAIIPVGQGPRGMAVSPNGTRLYVGNYVDSTVSVIDAQSMFVLGTIFNVPSPFGMVASLDGNKVYVVNQLANTVTVINTATNSIARTIPVGASPYGAALSPDGSRLYVANFNTYSVSVISTATDSVIATMPVGQGPFGVAVSPDGSRLYVTTNDNKLWVMNTATFNTDLVIPVGTHPQGVSVTPDGSKVFVANQQSNSVSILYTANNTVATIYIPYGPVAFGNFISPSYSVGTVVEFYNTYLDNYFITSIASEAADIDNGAAGPGWSRTGNTFKSGGNTPVCRFYGSQYPGPNSHFYTLAGSECDGIKQLQLTTPAAQKRWNFENLDFYSTGLYSGYCQYGTVPVFRAYNNGSVRGVDSNHRITTNYSAIQQVVARGWINEGIVMCAPQ